jgi:predicted SAM-dependent methyltransferase
LIRQSIKDAYYGILLPASRALRPIYRFHYGRRKGALRNVQLGCGSKYLDGFINIDGNFQRRVDYLMDIRAGLPFPDDSIEFIYSCHALEHLFVTDAMDVLRECRRVLTADGFLRLTLPDFLHAQRILRGEQTSSFPRSFVSREGQAINFLFCDGQHKFAYSPEVIREIAESIGFRRVEPATVGIIDRVGPLEEPAGSFAVNLYK